MNGMTRLKITYTANSAAYAIAASRVLSFGLDRRIAVHNNAIIALHNQPKAMIPIHPVSSHTINGTL
jgi:hypothetical protein